jgi:hypothetical protein
MERIVPGRDLGHVIEEPPIGLDWKRYVDHFKSEHGGWRQLADELIRRASDTVEVPLDPGSVEKGLRRLAAKKHRPGGDYGRWMLRFFGVPPDVERAAAWLAQYHSRFSDLPTSLRLEHLLLWDRPPLSESKVAAWIDVGMAAVLYHRGDRAAAAARLARARAGAERAGPSLSLEVSLLSAYVATNEQRRDEAEELFDRAESLLSKELEPADRACYRARLVAQRAFHLTKPIAGDADLTGALALFESIEEELDLPFVCFRKYPGLAYCRWKLGDALEGARLARLAATHAGDGGLIRFRAMALSMLAQMVEPDAAQPIGARAGRMARMLEDETLWGIVERRLRSDR